MLRVEDFQCFQDRDGANRILHRVVFCHGCGLIYTDPWLTSAGRRWLFERAGRSYGHCDPGERVAWVMRRCTGVRRVLDLGCGDGLFLRRFPPGIECLGVEADTYLGDLARATGKIQVIAADLNDRESWPAADVITLFHILEHLDDPSGMLRRLRSRSATGTRLLVEAPILDRAVETQGPDLCGFFSIAHRTHFSRGTLDHMMAAAGWEVIDRTDLPGNGYRVLARPGKLGKVPMERTAVEEELLKAREYCRVRGKSVERVIGAVAGYPKGCNLVIWGAGHHTEFLERHTGLFKKFSRYLLVDRDPLKSGVHIHGIPVVPPDTLDPDFWSAAGVQVLVSSYAWQRVIVQDLLALNVPRSAILTLYP
ncbi:MAG: class I SAM-dependent methyltransferase [Nitrospinaceae bacterium]